MTDYAPEGDPEFMPIDEMPPGPPRAPSYGHALQVLAISLRTGLKSPREAANDLMFMADQIRRKERL